MTDEYRQTLKRGISILSLFGGRAGILLVAACVIVCIMAWPNLAIYGSGISDTESQQLGMLRFVGTGPIQIELWDPNGNSVSRDLNQIDGAVFTDGDREVIIEIPHRITGDYELHVNVNGSAIRLQHFDVFVTDGVDTIQLADSVLIVNAPKDPYVIRSDSDGIAIAPEAAGTSSGISSTLIWVVAVAVGLLVGIVLIIRSRRRRRKR